jgi:hypothetical protein
MQYVWRSYHWSVIPSLDTWQSTLYTNYMSIRKMERRHIKISNVGKLSVLKGLTLENNTVNERKVDNSIFL